MSTGTCLFRPEIIPLEIDPLKSTPNGLPTAIIGSPKTSFCESPFLIALISLCFFILALTTAISDHLSVPMTLPIVSLSSPYVQICSAYEIFPETKRRTITS